MSENLDLSSGVISTTYVQLLHMGETAGIQSAGTGHYITDGNGTESVLSLDAGRVGIGTEAPASLLHVQDGAAAIVTNSADNADNHLEFYKSRNAADGSHTAVSASDGLGSILFYGSDGDSYSLAARISCVAYGTINDGDVPGELQFWTTNNGGSGAIPTQKMVILNDGNVGIGTTTPDGMLDIESTTATDDVPQVYITNLSDTADHQGGQLNFRRGDPSANLTDNDVLGDMFWWGQDNSDDAWINAAGIRCEIVGTPSTNQMPAELQFYTNSGGDSTVQRMVIDPSGDVGIGNAAPSRKLDVTGTGRFTSNVDFGASIYISSSGHCFLDGGSNTYITEVASDQVAIFTAGSERLRVGSTGNVGIGVTAGEKLQVGDNTSGENVYIEASTHTDAITGFRMSISGTPVWTIQNSVGDVLQVVDNADSDAVHQHLATTGSAWVENSDERIKKDITNLDSVLGAVNQLRPVNYKRKYSKYDKMYVGLIAQEVKTQFPIVVDGDENDFEVLTPTEEEPQKYKGAMGIEYTSLIPYLIKAIQELSAKVTALENA